MKIPKTMWVMIGLQAFFVFCAVYLATSVLKSFSEAEENMESRIGEEVIIQNDTLLIVDYSLLHNNYILSDGREVNPKVLK